MVTWYFAYDHLNDVKYFPVYIYEMLAVPDAPLSVAEHVAAGTFVVQQQNQYSFSQTSMDHIIEPTMIEIAKGGQIGFSNNANAVHRWILSFNQRAEISRSNKKMAEKTEGSHKKKG